MNDENIKWFAGQIDALKRENKCLVGDNFDLIKGRDILKAEIVKLENAATIFITERDEWKERAESNNERCITSGLLVALRSYMIDMERSGRIEKRNPIAKPIFFREIMRRDHEEESK